MHGDVRTLLRDAAQGPTRPIDTSALERAAGRSRAGRWIAGAAAAAAVVAAPLLFLGGVFPTPAGSGFAAAPTEVEGRTVEPAEAEALLGACLQQAGLPIRVGPGIEYDVREVSHEQVADGLEACADDLRADGVILPGEDPARLRVLYDQFIVYDACLRDAGIALFPPPPVEQFLAERLVGERGWSPQLEAETAVGEAAVQETGCTVPAAVLPD